MLLIYYEDIAERYYINSK